MPVISSIIPLIILKSSNSNLKDFYNLNYSISRYSQLVINHIESSKVNILEAILETDKEAKNNYIQTSKMNLEVLDDMLSSIKNNFTGNLILTNKLESASETLKTHYSQILELVIRSKNDEAFRIIKDEFIPVTHEMTEILDSISNLAYEHIQMITINRKHSILVSIMTFIILLIINVIIAIIFCIYTSNNIFSSIENFNQ